MGWSCLLLSKNSAAKDAIPQHNPTFSYLSPRKFLFSLLAQDIRLPSATNHLSTEQAAAVKHQAFILKYPIQISAELIVNHFSFIVWIPEFKINQAISSRLGPFNTLHVLSYWTNVIGVVNFSPTRKKQDR